MTVQSLREQYPRPRIGQQVELHDREGSLFDVVMVRKARDVLRMKTELEAMLMGPRLQASFGIGWLDVYYEAAVKQPGDIDVTWVTTVDVKRVVD